MKRYNYFYDKIPITKMAFLASVPDNWMDDLDQYGDYSYGYYKAVRIDDDGDDEPTV